MRVVSIISNFFGLVILLSNGQRRELAGVFVQSRSDVRTIQEANAELRLLRDAEVTRALVEDRGVVRGALRAAIP